MVLFESAVDSSIGLIGTAIEVFGVLIIVSGIVWATYAFARGHRDEQHYEAYKFRIGRSLLLGLEVLVAADIVKTIALDLTAKSLGVLAALVLIRTFLSWSLTVEIEGRWPWQRGREERGRTPANPTTRTNAATSGAGAGEGPG
jgi:uncharacterized membrane protein